MSDPIDINSVRTRQAPTFRPVTPDELREAWAYVRPALDTMDRPDGWLPEDVYMTLRSNGASLYMLYDETGQKAGFFILRLLSDFDGPRLHIWILYAKDAEFDPMALFAEDLDAIARSCKAPRITFSTNRPGWHKLAPRYDFTPREITYEKPVQVQS